MGTKAFKLGLSNGLKKLFILNKSELEAIIKPESEIED